MLLPKNKIEKIDYYVINKSRIKFYVDGNIYDYLYQPIDSITIYLNHRILPFRKKLKFDFPYNIEEISPRKFNNSQDPEFIELRDQLRKHCKETFN